jgi:hypothetical protein
MTNSEVKFLLLELQCNEAKAVEKAVGRNWHKAWVKHEAYELALRLAISMIDAREDEP